MKLSLCLQRLNCLGKASTCAGLCIKWRWAVSWFQKRGRRKGTAAHCILGLPVTISECSHLELKLLRPSARHTNSTHLTETRTHAPLDMQTHTCITMKTHCCGLPTHTEAATKTCSQLVCMLIARVHDLCSIHSRFVLQKEGAPVLFQLVLQDSAEDVSTHGCQQTV